MVFSSFVNVVCTPPGFLVVAHREYMIRKELDDTVSENIYFKCTVHVMWNRSQEAPYETVLSGAAF